MPHPLPLGKAQGGRAGAALAHWSLRVNNLMRVLGTEATQDPTAMEKFVRAEMEARRSAHDQRNQDRKLTPEERRAKEQAKMQKEADENPVVTIFKVCHAE